MVATYPRGRVAALARTDERDLVPRRPQRVRDEGDRRLHPARVRRPVAEDEDPHANDTRAPLAAAATISRLLSPSSTVGRSTCSPAIARTQAATVAA